MKVSEEFDNPKGGRIQFAVSKDGGNSSWGEKEGYQADSVRLAWYNNGKFDPYSSAELPIWGLKDLIIESAKRDLYKKEELADMIGQLTASLYRQA